MNESKELIQLITEGIQDKKGKEIIIANLTNIDEALCQYFVICQGDSPTQVSAIVDSIRESTLDNAGIKPCAIDGLRNAEWVAMDYGNIMAHVFLPDVRAFYDLEHLWADATLTKIPNLD